MNSDDPFPRWNEPATKGDLIRAIVSTRSLIAQMQSCLVQLYIKDEAGMLKALQGMDQYWTQSSAIIDEIGGKVRS